MFGAPVYALTFMPGCGALLAFQRQARPEPMSTAPHRPSSQRQTADFRRTRRVRLTRIDKATNHTMPST